MENNNYGYVCMYGGKRIELYADSSYKAQCKAELEFQKGTRKKVKGYDIIVVLAERNGEQVIHNGSIL